MTGSVTWRSKYGKLAPEYEDTFAFFDNLRRTLILCLCWSVDGNMGIARKEIGNTVDMIVMVMGKEDRFRLPVVFFYRVQDRYGLAGINNDASAIVID